MYIAFFPSFASPSLRLLEMSHLFSSSVPSKGYGCFHKALMFFLCFCFLKSSFQFRIVKRCLSKRMHSTYCGDYVKRAKSGPKFLERIGANTASLQQEAKRMESDKMYDGSAYELPGNYSRVVSLKRILTWGQIKGII